MRYVLLTILFTLYSCQLYVTETKSVSLSGKYVVSKLEITNVDQNQTKDQLYLLGTTFRDYNNDWPDPFNNIPINNFYIHFDYSTIRMGLKGVTTSGEDIWIYGTDPNYIYYKVFGGTPFYSGNLQFDYLKKTGGQQRMTFMIEDDGFETLQLKSSGVWPSGKMGQKQVMTLYLTRVGP